MCVIFPMCVILPPVFATVSAMTEFLPPQIAAVDLRQHSPGESHSALFHGSEKK